MEKHKNHGMICPGANVALQMLKFEQIVHFGIIYDLSRQNLDLKKKSAFWGIFYFQGPEKKSTFAKKNLSFFILHDIL